MTLTDIEGLGLPAWAVIGAALIFILKQVGLLDFLLSRIRDSSEFEQSQIEAENAARQSEQVALWSQMTKLQTKSLEQNELLLEYIINTSVEWHKQHSDRIDEVIREHRQINYELKQLATKFTMMVGIIESQISYGKTQSKNESH